MSSEKEAKLCVSCTNLVELYGTNEFAVPWRCTCNATPNPDDQVKSVQMKITNDLDVLFSQEDLRLYRLHRRVRGFNKSGRRNKKVS